MIRLAFTLAALCGIASSALVFIAVGWQARQRLHEHDHARCPLAGMLPDGTRARIDTWQCDDTRCGVLVVITREDSDR